MTSTAQKTLFNEPETTAPATILPTGDVIIHLDGAHRPVWMSDALAAAVSAGRQAIKFTRPEKKILKKRKKLRPSVWAEKHRIVTMSVFPGPWRNEVTPYLVGIMDGCGFESVREVDICKGPQSGVTEAIHNVVGSIIDQDPGPVMYVFPDQTMTEENARDRILPMIRKSGRLRGYLTGNRHDEAGISINLAHMPIYMAWATSVSRLSNKPIKVMIGDEVSKYQLISKKETSSLKLMDKRLNTYREVSKFIRLSTPAKGENDPIWTGLQKAKKAGTAFYYWVRCPDCGKLQHMTFKQIKFFGCRDAGEMISASLARYECIYCSEKWDDHGRNRAVAGGQWQNTDKEDGLGIELSVYLEKFRPRHIAFHLPAWITRFVSMSESAASFLESLSGDPVKKMDFATQHAAEAYVSVLQRPVESEYKAAIRKEIPAQTVPESAVALTCGIDCQKIGFYFLVRAWARDFTSWLVHYDKLATWADVENLLFNQSYPVIGAGGETGRRMAIARAAIDTGGSKFNPDTSMTEAAYMWLRKNGVGRGARCWGIKGDSWGMPNKIKMSRPIDKAPSGKPIPGGLQILLLDTEKFKDNFFFRLGKAADPGDEIISPAYLHAETGDDYFAHITAEEKKENDKGIICWQQIGARRNDWLDCEVYAAAAADPEWPEGGIQLMVPPPEPAQVQKKPQKSRPDRGSRW